MGKNTSSDNGSCNEKWELGLLRERTMKSSDAIGALKAYATDPTVGLPDDLFYFVSEITPMVNVDLLIKDPNGRVLLAWRDDPLAGQGWHLPGGIVRFRETLETRIQKVAETEVGALVDFDPAPVAINQVINYHRETRGHFISILYKCSLPPILCRKTPDYRRGTPGS